MKIKDTILAALITVNLLLVAGAAALLVYHSEPAAYAGAAVDRAEFIRLSTLRFADDREGLAVIDTLENKMIFLVPTQGRKEVVRQGQVIDLATAFKHPTKP